MAMVLFFRLVFGLVFGSFANVVIYRLPRGESIVNPPSHCPSCGERLSSRELVPVFSWVFQRGHCRHCHAKISPKYPLIELVCGLLFLLVPIKLCLFAFMLLCIAAIDFTTQTIPDSLVIALAVSGLVNITSIPNALLGALIGGGVIFLIDRTALLLIKKDGFGFGDVLLMAAIGLTLGAKLTVTTLFFGFILGGAVGAAIKLLKPKLAYMPFAPCLAFSALLSVWCGSTIFDWYVGLF